MIKRLGKAKKKKQGAILVIVVLILALAMIFISMAMLLTKATRNRLYENAMSSQARLTVTSAAEVFLEALQTQEITDKQMDGFLSESPTKADGAMKMVIAGVPGMSEDADNCTLLNIYYPDKTSKPNVVYCDFTTTIGDQVENVRVELSIQPEDKSKPSDRFSNQIDQYSALGDSRLFFTGGIGAVRDSELNPTDNTVLLRNGNSTTTASGGIYYSDVVFANDAVWNGDSAKYYGDLIFLDEAYVTSKKTLDANFEKNVYFLGGNDKPGFKLNSATNGDWANLWGSFKPQNIIFDGRRVVDDDDSKKIEDLVNGTTCYFVGKTSGTLIDVAKTKDGNAFNVTNTSGTLSGDLLTKYTTVSAYDYSSTGNSFPTDIVSDVFQKMNPDGEVMIAGENTQLSYDTYAADGSKIYYHTDKIPEGKEYVVNPLTQYYPSYKKNSEGDIPDSQIIYLSRNSSLGTLDAADGHADRIINLEPGYYYLKPGTYAGGYTLGDVNQGSGDDYGLKPYVIAIDGSQGGDYRFYFAPGTYNLVCCVFAIYNPNNTEPVVFVLEPGAEVIWGASDQKWCDMNSLCSVGIVSIDRNTTGTTRAEKALAIGEYIQTTKMSTENENASEGDKFGYSTFYDGVVKPSAYVFGSTSGSSGAVFSWGGVNTIFEAYIGLYGENSKMHTEQGTKPIWFYGRVETYDVDNYNTSGHNAYMPYCPGPATSGDPLPDERPAETKYKVAAITYYYGTGIPEGT